MFIVSDILSDNAIRRYEFITIFSYGTYEEQINFLDKYHIRKYLGQPKHSYAIIDSSRIISRIVVPEDIEYAKNYLKNMILERKVSEFEVSDELHYYLKLRCL